jgi:hypothetical protein
MGPGQHQSVFPVGPAWHSEYLPSSDSSWCGETTDESANRRQRHHDLQPCFLGCREGPHRHFYGIRKWELCDLRTKTAVSGGRVVRAERSACRRRHTPPISRNNAEVESLLRQPMRGLPSANGFTYSPYKPRLGLDYIAPPEVGIGVGNYGSFVGGGTAFQWSDLLGYHNLTTIFQTSVTTEGGNFLNSLSAVGILGALGIIPSRGVPPVDAALFYDAGIAWRNSETASFLGGTRKPVKSYGGSLRVNLLGFAIGQISYVRPLDRPQDKWRWEFSLLPGF